MAKKSSNKLSFKKHKLPYFGLVSFILLGLVATGYGFYKANFAKAASGCVTQTVKLGQTDATFATMSGNNKCVSYLQKLLNANYADWDALTKTTTIPLTEDGQFGAKTETRIKENQNLHNFFASLAKEPTVTVDGIVGPSQTWKVVCNVNAADDPNKTPVFPALKANPTITETANYNKKKEAWTYLGCDTLENTNVSTPAITAGEGECATPVGLMVQPHDAQSVDLKWSIVKGAETYTLWWAKASSSYGASVTTNAQGLRKVQALTSGINYKWKIKANCVNAGSTEVEGPQFETYVPSNSIAPPNLIRGFTLVKTYEGKYTNTNETYKYSIYVCTIKDTKKLKMNVVNYDSSHRMGSLLIFGSWSSQIVSFGDLNMFGKSGYSSTKELPAISNTPLTTAQGYSYIGTGKKISYSYKAYKTTNTAYFAKASASPALPSTVKYCNL